MARADPNVADDDDPTQILIRVGAGIPTSKKSPSYIDGRSRTYCSRARRLRYTITVQNVGTDNATGVDDR